MNAEFVIFETEVIQVLRPAVFDNQPVLGAAVCRRDSSLGAVTGIGVKPLLQIRLGRKVVDADFFNQLDAGPALHAGRVGVFASVTASGCPESVRLVFSNCRLVRADILFGKPVWSPLPIMVNVTEYLPESSLWGSVPVDTEVFIRYDFIEDHRLLARSW